MKRLLIGSLLKVAPLLLLGVSSASASMVQYAADIFSPSGSEMPLNSVTLTLTKFDVTGGLVLTNAELFVYWTDTSRITVENIDNLNAHAFSGATASVPLTLSGSGFSNLMFTASAGPINSASSTPGFTNAPSGPVAGMNVPQAVTFVGFPCPPGQVCSFSGINRYDNVKSNGQSSTTVSAGNLGLFSTIGFGTFNVTLLGGIPVFSGTEIGGSNHLLFSGDVLLGGRVVVMYTFENPGASEVPEPMTLLLVGTAVLGMALKLRRRPG